MMIDPKWQDQLHRRITPRMFKSLLAATALNQTTAARYLGYSLRTMRRMAAGKTKVPVSALLLLRLMQKHSEGPLVPEKKRRSR